MINLNANNHDPKFVLCVPKGWNLYISCEFNEIHLQLVSLGWHLCVIDEMNDCIILAHLRTAQAILLWEAYEFLERNEHLLSTSIRKIFFCDDVHFFTEHRRSQRLRAFQWADLILATYPDKLCEWYPEISVSKVKWSPHAAAACFSPVFEPVSNRILLSGSRTWPYPFRQYCQIKIPLVICDVIDHPGYPGYPGDKANQSKSDLKQMQAIGRERYADLLRKYPVMLVCGSIFSYLVAKVFEGMATGCLVLCDRTSLGSQLEKLGFIEGEHYIGTDIFHVVEDAFNVQNMFISQRQKWETIVYRAAECVQNKHTTEIRAFQIHSICLEKL